MAVYTSLTNEQISAVIETVYGLGTLVFAVGITQGVENTNYLIAVADHTGAETNYILTLYEKRMAPADLPFFIQLMQHVAARGITCPTPIPCLNGALTCTVEGKLAAIVSFVPGKSRTLLSNSHVASVGGALGGLHVAAADFTMQRENGLSLAGWQTLARSMQGALDGIYEGLDLLVREELTNLEAHWPTVTSLPRGIIHADLFPDNVFFEDDAVSGIIDFYFACSDTWAYDVAITLNAWCFEAGGEFNPMKSKLMLAAYQKKRALNAAEIAALNTLLRGAALRFLLTRAYDWLNRAPDAQVKAKNPMEYAGKLRFHQQVKSVHEYGI